MGYRGKVHRRGHHYREDYPRGLCGIENKDGTMKFDTWARVTCKHCQNSRTANSATTRWRRRGGGEASTQCKYCGSPTPHLCKETS